MSQPVENSSGAPLVQPSKFGRRLGTVAMIILILLAAIAALGGE